MRVAQADELMSRALAVVEAPELFGAAGGAYVRGYTTAELAAWTELSTGSDGRLDAAARDVLQFCEVVIRGPEPDAKPLFCGETGKPRRVDLDHVREHVLPGELRQAVNLSDALSGFGSAEQRRSFVLAAGGAISAAGAPTGSGDSPSSSPPRM